MSHADSVQEYEETINHTKTIPGGSQPNGLPPKL